MNILAAIILFFTPFNTYIISGNSMSPTLKNGEMVKVYKKDAKINDMIVFECHSEKCDQGNKIITKGKRLMDKRDKCYYVKGDNQPTSFDSEDYGWLCGEEIKVLGVIIK